MTTTIRIPVQSISYSYIEITEDTVEKAIDELLSLMRAGSVSAKEFIRIEFKQTSDKND